MSCRLASLVCPRSGPLAPSSMTSLPIYVISVPFTPQLHLLCIHSFIAPTPPADLGSGPMRSFHTASRPTGPLLWVASRRPFRVQVLSSPFLPAHGLYGPLVFGSCVSPAQAVAQRAGGRGSTPSTVEGRERGSRQSVALALDWLWTRMGAECVGAGLDCASRQGSSCWPMELSGPFWPPFPSVAHERATPSYPFFSSVRLLPCLPL